jgi:hypothetical protein
MALDDLGPLERRELALARRARAQAAWAATGGQELDPMLEEQDEEEN